MGTKVVGADVLLTIGGVTVGGQRGCTLNMSADTIDTSDKTTSGYKTAQAGLLEWSVEMDSILEYGDTGFDALETAFQNRTSVSAVVSINSGAKTYTGTAYVTELSLDAPHDDAGSSTCTLVGASALVIA